MSPDPRPLRLHMQKVRKSFPGVVALDDVDLEVAPGEVHVLLGENGAGKSTLMKILSGSLGKDSGEIRVDGQTVEIQGPRHAQQLGIRTIYQELNLVPPLSAAANIFLGKEPGRWGVLDRRAAEKAAARLLADLGVSVDPARPVRELGIAHQQMVEVAKALSEEGRILIMDEPTSALTAAEIDQLFATIERLRARGTSIIYISHRLEEVARIGDRVTVMRDGRRVTTLPARATPIPELVRLMADREVGEHFPRRRHAPGDELLRVEHLTRGTHVRDVSFTLRRREIVGITGLLGAGRTELARTLVGAEPAQSGTVTLRGRAVVIRHPSDALGHGIGLVPEDRKTQGLVLGLSVERNVALPNTRRLSPWGVVRSATESALAGRCVTDLHIKTPSLGQPARLLSGGNQQKIVLGKWLAAYVDLLIVDEPTRGIDVPAKIEIYELMNTLTAEGKGILMISSELPEVLGMSDRVLVMRGGRVVAELESTRTTQAEVLAFALGQASYTRVLKGATARRARELGTLVGLVALVALLSVLTPHFLSVSNLLNVMEQTSINAVIAVGMTFVILSGGIDLSVGSLLALSGVVLASALQAGWPAAAAILAGLAVGGASGLVNGLLITRGRLPAFIATLGMMSIARGAALVFTAGRPISGFAASFRQLSTARLLGIPAPIVVTIVVYAIGHFLLTRTRFGRYVYAIGGNEEATRLSGISAGFHKTMVYVLSGVASGLAAALLTARLNSAQPIAGINYELDAIAATVIGGTSLSGGVGTLHGTLIGALIMGVLRNGLNLLGTSSFFQQIVIGIVIITAVLVDSFLKPAAK